MDSRDSRKRTPLCLAASGNSKGESIQPLLDAGAGLHAKDPQGRTPLHMTVDGDSDGRIERASILIRAGADLHAKDSQGQTPLHKAVGGQSDHQLEKASKLIKLGADLYAKDNKGRTPLMYAEELSDTLFKHTKERDLSMVELLKKADNPSLEQVVPPNPL